MGRVLIVTPLLRRLQARYLKHLSMCDLLTNLSVTRPKTPPKMDGETLTDMCRAGQESTRTGQGQIPKLLDHAS